MTGKDPGGAAWHALSIDEVLSALGSAADCLSTSEAAARQDRYGPNQLAPPQPASLTEIVLGQLRSVIVFLLLAAVIIPLLAGDRLEATAIAGGLRKNQRTNRRAAQAG